VTSLAEPLQPLVAVAYAAGRAGVWRDSDGRLWLSDDVSADEDSRISEEIDSGQAAIEFDEDGTQYVIVGGVLPRHAAEVRLEAGDGAIHTVECENGFWVAAFLDECGLPVRVTYRDAEGESADIYLDTRGPA
jgi:hypothetical protein